MQQELSQLPFRYFISLVIFLLLCRLDLELTVVFKPRNLRNFKTLTSLNEKIRIFYPFSNKKLGEVHRHKKKIVTIKQNKMKILRFFF
jgi:hypothetical protein